MEDRDHRAGHLSQRGHEARRDDDAAGCVRLRRAPGATLLGGAGGALAAIHRVLHRALRGEPVHVREQFPGREDGHRLRRPLERAQADRRRRLRRRKEGPLQRNRAPRLSTGLSRRDSRDLAMTPPTPEAVPISATRRWAITFTVMVIAFMQILDTSVTNVILPHLQGSLSAGLDEASWVITSYLAA